MGAELLILGWKAAGLRCPDHEVKFASPEGEQPAVSLIQMPNGTGKTTTLHLLRATMSGDAGNWKPEEVQRLRKMGNVSGAGVFRLDLLLDKQRLTIELSLDFEDRVARYRTTFGSGIKDGFHPPPIIRRFLKRDFVPLFVFDGELAESLLHHEHTNAADAIDSLFQLKFFQSISTRVQEFWDQSVQRAGAVATQGLNRRQNRLSFLRSRLVECEIAHREKVTLKDNLKGELALKKSQFRDSIKLYKEYSAKLQKAENELKAARQDLQLKTNGVMLRIRDPQALSDVFAQEMADLRSNLDRAKLPESAAREFFEELADEAECVCGRPLDAECRKAIRERASNYLGSEDVALLNAIKTAVADQIGENPREHQVDLERRMEELKDVIRLEAEMQTARDAIQEDAVSNNPELEEAQNHISELERSLGLAEKDVEKFEDPTDSRGDEDTYGVKILQKRLADAERKVAEVTQTLDLKAKRDVLLRILERAHHLARQSISKETVVHANERISQLMPDNAIRIEKIDKCLVLQGQEGGSMGETLSIAYAFLSTLFYSADHKLPFIVDSPAGPIDLAVRPKIAELIPRLTNQFIAFTISSERQGFVGNLASASSGGIAYYTLFRKGNIEIEITARAISGHSESGDGILVPGREFFSDFQIDREEEG